MLSLSDIVNVKVGIGRGVFEAPGATVIGGKKPSFNLEILKLFANNEQGFFYDPNDLSTMYQDAAGTIPITAVGQPVGMIKDKSGRNNHASQTTSASRPILQRNATTGAYYLAFDGADDFLQTNNIDFTATDKVSLFAGVRKLSDATFGVITEFSGSTDTNNGTFFLVAPRNNTLGNFGFRSKGTSNGDITSPSSYISPHSAVLNVVGNISQDSSILRINGLQVGTGITDQGTGNYGNYPLYIGRRGGSSLPFNGHIYGLIGIGKLTTDDETAAIEKELAKRVGVTLNV